MDLRLGLDDNGVASTITGLVANVGDMKRPLAQFRLHMNQVTVEHFNALAMGGTHRGVRWAYFKNPAYVRKTDGVEVPPWGGVPNIGQYSDIRKRQRANQKARGERPGRTNKNRMVLGRKRPSGARLKYGDAVLQDTRRMLRSVTSSPDVLMATEDSITWGSRLPYAGKQNERRPFLFFTDDDARMLGDLVLAQMMREGRAS